MTKPLSAEALAIWDAFNDVSERVVFEDYGDALAAAFRVIADINVGTDYQNGKRVATILRSDILAIADELEATEW